MISNTTTLMLRQMLEDASSSDEAIHSCCHCHQPLMPMLCVINVSTLPQASVIILVNCSGPTQKKTISQGNYPDKDGAEIYGGRGHTPSAKDVIGEQIRIVDRFCLFMALVVAMELFSNRERCQQEFSWQLHCKSGILQKSDPAVSPFP
jgi:hypothetical protein